MDLKTELLKVLDNPAQVWDAVLTNLATEPRMSLLILATCATPITLVHWQEAVARVSAEAAVQFEASLRVLDDSFVRTFKEENKPARDASYRADFRNPSMDDFCAGHLDRNVGIAINVAARNPTLHQIRRLVDLGTEYAPYESDQHFPRPRKCPNIYEALIAHPSVLFNRLLELMPVSAFLAAPSIEQGEQTEIVELNLILFSQAHTVSDKDFSVAQARMAPLIRELKFGPFRANHLLYRILGNRSTVLMMESLLGDEFRDFHKDLWRSASSPRNFDALVDLDEALHRSPIDVDWADHFKEYAEDWLDSDMGSSSDIDSARTIYERVFAYLDFSPEDDKASEWDDKYDEAVAVERKESEIEEDSSWRDSSFGKSSRLTELKETSQINNMFSSLKETDYKS